MSLPVQINVSATRFLSEGAFTMVTLRRNLSALLSLAMLASQPVFGQSVATIQSPPSSKSTTSSQALPTIPFEKFKLKNGLEVVLSEDHRLPLVAVNLWYHVGPANELPGRTGFAHLFEHMMFEGSKNVGAKAHFKNLEAAGASLINGTTDFDRTNYFETLPSNELALALWLESDRMGYLLDTLDREKLANQRDVVRNERRQSIENVPYGLVEEAQFHALFPKTHPYYANVIGSHADVEAARLKDVRDFFKQYYTPNNASLAIVGDIDKAQAKAMVEKFFGSIPAGPPVPKIDTTTPAITQRRTVEVTDRVELPRLYMSWLTPQIFKSGDAEADLAAHILGGGKSSRLYKKLVYEQQIAQDVQVSNNGLMLASVFTVQATAKPGVKLEDLEKAINEEVALFCKTGPTQAELDGARNTIEMHIIGRLESLGGFGGVADRLNLYNYFLGDPGYLPQDLARYDKATLADLKQFSDKYLTANSCVVVRGMPGKKAVDDVPRAAQDTDKESIDSTIGSSPAEPWRAERPKASVVPRLVLPTPNSFKLANGLTVYLVERHNLPVVAAHLVTLSGSCTNPIDKPGLSAFTADMLDEGTASRPTLTIAEDLDRIGTSLHTGSGPDAAWAKMHGLAKTVEPGLAILSDVILNPAFESKEIDRVRNRRLTSLQQENDHPNTIAKRVLYKILYGPENALGYDDEGTIESTKATSREDMLKFWQTHYVPENSALVIAGDLSADRARTLAEKYFGSWKGSAPPIEKQGVKHQSERAVYIVKKDAAPQTAIRIGTMGMPHSDPDYVPARVMNTAFGGMFSSRLNMNLREKHGYTYGAGAGFTFLRSPSPFVASSSIRTDVTGPAVHEFFNEIEGMTSRPVSADELTIAKDNIALGLPGMFETSTKVADKTGEIFIHNLPLDYYGKLPGTIDATTAEDVERVAKKYLIPENMIVVAVGDKAKIEPELKKLNLGPIKELDFEANPVK
jgi:zinc protease